MVKFFLFTYFFLLLNCAIEHKYWNVSTNPLDLLFDWQIKKVANQYCFWSKAWNKNLSTDWLATEMPCPTQAERSSIAGRFLQKLTSCLCNRISNFVIISAIIHSKPLRNPGEHTRPEARTTLPKKQICPKSQSNPGTQFPATTCTPPTHPAHLLHPAPAGSALWRLGADTAPTERTLRRPGRATALERGGSAPLSWCSPGAGRGGAVPPRLPLRVAPRSTGAAAGQRGERRGGPLTRREGGRAAQGRAEKGRAEGGGAGGVSQRCARDRHYPKEGLKKKRRK